jgi:hypothetical protein
MAKLKSGADSTPGEVAAAHADIDQFASRIGKHNDVFKRHIETLQAERDELKESLTTERAANEKHVAGLTQKLEAMKLQAQQAIAARDETIRRVSGIINQPLKSDSSILG